MKIAIVVFLMALVFAAPAAATSNYLDFQIGDICYQMYPNYCAPANAQMIENYYDLYPYTQYKIGQNMGLFPNGNNATTIQFKNYIINYQHKTVTEYPASSQFSRIKTEINAGRPVILWIYEWNSPVLIIGYNDVAGKMSDSIRIVNNGIYDVKYYTFENRIATSNNKILIIK